MTHKASLFALVALLSAAAPQTPLAAQATEAPVSGRTLTIYGNDQCPRDQICVRAPESERYRIPNRLRRTENTPGDQPWNQRAESVTSAGASGIGSCTTSGPGGSTGCTLRAIRQARAEKKQQAEETPVIDPTVE